MRAQDRTETPATSSLPAASLIPQETENSSMVGHGLGLEMISQVLYRASGYPSGACPQGDRHSAGVVEPVDAPDLKSGSERSVGSIPTTRTTVS